MAWRAQWPASTKTGMFPHASGRFAAASSRCSSLRSHSRGELYVCVGCLGAIAPSKPVSCATQFLGSKGLIESAAFFAAASGVDAPVRASCMDSWMASEIFG